MDIENSIVKPVVDGIVPKFGEVIERTNIDGYVTQAIWADAFKGVLTSFNTTVEATAKYQITLLEETTKRDAIAKERANVHDQEVTKRQQDLSIHNEFMSGREENMKFYRTMIEKTMAEGNTDACKYYSEKHHDLIMRPRSC